MLRRIISLNAASSLDCKVRQAAKSAVIFAVVQQPLGRHRAVQHTQKILRGDTVPRFIVENRHDGRAIRDEGTNDHDFGDRVIRTAGMSRESLGPGQRSEKNDGVPAQLDIVPEGRLGVLGEHSDRGIELERLQFA